MNIFNYNELYTKVFSFLLCGFLGFLVFYIIGCQDVLLEANREVGCSDELEVEGAQTCKQVGTVEAEMHSPGEGSGDESGGQGGDTGTDQSPTSRVQQTPVFELTFKVPLGRRDILFVVDNSGSMKPELASIAHQFDQFLNSIKKADYQIAIISTDWAFDRGQFLEFSNGQIILSNPQKSDSVHRQNVGYFQETVKRPVGNSYSNDERGIYALNMALDNATHSSFWRPHSILQVIIVSDEDERSFGGSSNKPLESYDLPEVFFRKFSHTQSYSMVTVHSIIVKPGDTQCKSQSGGVEGRIYAQASEPSQKIMNRYNNIVRGHIGSICSKNYSSQLGPISEKINVPHVPLRCNPVGGRMSSFRVNGREISNRVEGRKLIVEEKVPFNSVATLIYKCTQQQN